MMANVYMSTFHLPHSLNEWPSVKAKLQAVADKVTVGSLEAIGEVVMASPYWGLNQPPLLNTLNKTLSSGTHYNKETFFGDILPYIARRAMEVETYFPEKTIQVSPGILSMVQVTLHMTINILHVLCINSCVMSA